MPKVYFDHIHLASPDPKKTAEAYKKMFGAKITVQEMAPGRVIAKVDLGGVLLLITPAREGQVGLLHFGVRTDNLKQAVTELKADGVTFTQDVREVRPDFKMSFLTAPENVSIELQEGSL